MAEHALAAIEAGLFDDGQSAHEAVDRLAEGGFDRARVHVRGPDGPLARTPYGKALLVGLSFGVVLGLAGGLLLGWAATQGTGTIGPPTAGTDVVVIMALFAVFGAGAGATAGALLGICAVGDPAVWLNQSLEGGRWLVGVETPDGPSQVRATRVLEGAGALEVLFLGKSETAERVFV
ncbi:MAG: hypothetical protein J2P40_02035 [Candidatus Dormibacteraeota bacterium]|nr:hypothetical protein [Candidatus Dormibacteraeota bacterium]MBO0704888.1 hypothetical protein [Candidatus Dormibacteraeota bacterium]MBO0760032.1 hypothetical protein [Candidatus Dormibacteraeota bacterium]